MYSTLEQTSCVLYLFSGYRVFKFTLFLAGFAAGFFFTYLLCSGYLVDHLPEKALEHKDQVSFQISLDVAGPLLVSHPVVIWVVRQPCPFFDPLAFLETSRGLGSSC